MLHSLKMLLLGSSAVTIADARSKIGRALLNAAKTGDVETLTEILPWYNTFDITNTAPFYLLVRLAEAALKARQYFTLSKLLEFGAPLRTEYHSTLTVEMKILYVNGRIKHLSTIAAEAGRDCQIKLDEEICQARGQLVHLHTVAAQTPRSAIEEEIKRWAAAAKEVQERENAEAKARERPSSHSPSPSGPILPQTTANQAEDFLSRADTAAETRAVSPISWARWADELEEEENATARERQYSPPPSPSAPILPQPPGNAAKDLAGSAVDPVVEKGADSPCGWCTVDE